MKTKIKITTMFNDVFTDYKDKIDSVYIIVDNKKDCECTKSRKCGICKLIENNEKGKTLNEINSIQRKRDFEILTYQKDMFWHEPEKQNLIEKLLQKIYDLEDEISLMKIQT